MERFPSNVDQSRHEMRQPAKHKKVEWGLNYLCRHGILRLRRFHPASH